MKIWGILHLRNQEFQRVRVILSQSSEAFTRTETLVPVIILGLVLIMAARIPLDSDQWWHLRAGAVTWEQRSPVTIDQFSFTREGSRWINHSWLSELLMFLMFRWGDFRGLTFMVAGLAAVTIGLVYLQIEGSPLTRAFLLVAGIPTIALVWSPRPQMFSLLCFGILAYLLYLYKWQRKNLLWISPLLFIVWSNLHGGYPLGLLLMIAFIVGEILNHLFYQSGDKNFTRNELAQIIFWLGLSALAVIINPNWTLMWSIPFRTVSIRVLQDHIEEWKSPDLHEIQQQTFLWLLLATFGVIGLSKRRLDGSDLLSLVIFAYLGMLARRNIAPFGMIAIPVLSRHLPHLSFNFRDSVLSILKNPEVNRRISKKTSLLINGILIFSIIVGASYKIDYVSSSDLFNQHERQEFPYDAVQWIKANKPKGNLFNSYNWGGYLIWNLPEYPVFIDGRTDLFGDDLLEDYLNLMRGDDGWEQLLDFYDINLILIENGSTLGKVLRKSVPWRLEYKDDKAEIYIRAD